ncbi:myosin light chain kinase A-like [Coccinella septempunctata]|uniref:myosin light chain kinase A-like n=1 Tax=Coccinella septempunctata TaxID=41139 RepID=UPI001D064D5B|nr:myosin light chain kinase A-like [Coccinella septempunctata]
MRPIVDIKSRCFDISRNVIGAGAFSLVKIAFNKGDKTPIALKICHCNSESEWLQSLNEICLLKKLIHKNVARINNYEITRFHVLIGLDKGDATLKQLISNEDIVRLRSCALPIMGQIINALNFIHDFKIVHGDIKPNNIIYNLICNQISIQIMDFGLSHVVGRIDSPTLGDAGGTKVYLAPERLSHSNYDESSDLFSAGIVFFEMLFKLHPFYKEGDNYAEFMKNKPVPRFPQGYQSQVPKEWLEILCSMLSYNPKNREEVRNNNLLKTNYIKKSMDHQAAALRSIANGEEAEKTGRYAESAIHFMDASINLAISKHEADVQNKDFISDLNSRVIDYRKKALLSIHLFKHSFSHYQSTAGFSVYDEYYEYLMEVTASTPSLKHYLEIGYNGELYLCENKQEIAFKNFMDALQYLNQVMPSEPSGDRKTIIGKKMLQWTNMAETLRTS